MLRDHYEVLGISEHATPEEIEVAYQETLVSNNPAPRAAVEEAYSTLSDTARRAEYDEQRTFVMAAITAEDHNPHVRRPLIDFQQPMRRRIAKVLCVVFICYAVFAPGNWQNLFTYGLGIASLLLFCLISSNRLDHIAALVLSVGSLASFLHFLRN